MMTTRMRCRGGGGGGGGAATEPTEDRPPRRGRSIKYRHVVSLCLRLEGGRSCFSTSTSILWARWEVVWCMYVMIRGV
jgi:hypothetical protein